MTFLPQFFFVCMCFSIFFFVLRHTFQISEISFFHVLFPFFFGWLFCFAFFLFILDSSFSFGFSDLMDCGEVGLGVGRC